MNLSHGSRGRGRGYELLQLTSVLSEKSYQHAPGRFGQRRQGFNQPRQVRVRGVIPCANCAGFCATFRARLRFLRVGRGGSNPSPFIFHFREQSKPLNG